MIYQPYRSKDFIIEGSYLLLDAEKSWERIDKRMRTSIRKAETYNPKVVEVSGNEEDVRRFAEFCPRADTLPPKIAENQKMFFCFLGEELAGGLILTEITGNLFLQFNAITNAARKKQISSFLLWEMVKIFSGSKYKYLDVGAAYRESLQKYFTGWQTQKYPILMKPPEIKPQIMINPFDSRFLGLGGDLLKTEEEFAKKWGNREFTIFPRGMYAIASLIKWFKLEGKLNENDEICIKTTSGSKYISGCVTSAIEETCKWSQEINEKTRAIFIIHEFGFPHPETKKLRERCNEKGIPLIEDCAYLWESGEAGKYGDYLIYSMTKVFPMQFGGILVGKKFEPEYVWDNFACCDTIKSTLVKRQLSNFLGEPFERIKKKRIENYNYYLNVFGNNRSLFEREGGVMPGAFILRVEDEKRMRDIKSYVEKFGVECGAYWHNNAIFLPVHQNLDKPQLDYIIGAVLAMFRNGCGVYNLPR